MNKLLWYSLLGALFLLLGVSPLAAQEVVFSTAPTPTPAAGGSNGGFAWLDVNGDGTQDLFIPPNNVLLNNTTFFTQIATTKTAALSNNVNSVGGLFADINGDGMPDIWSTNNAAPNTGLFFDSLGTYVPATGVGQLASAGITGSVFAGMAVADIDHSNYLSAVWHGHKNAAWADGAILPRGTGIEFLKGGPSGFTRVGNGAAAGQAIIDTTRAFETWGVHFIDANKDGYQDLLMPSFRHGFRAFNGGSDTIGAKKGSILFLNDGTGKFYVPGAASVGRTLYALDSMSAAGAFYARAVADTGIIVEDTVRHFNAIGSQWGDLNNDGNVDLLFTGTEANNYDGLRRATNIVLIYGKGDGTFTFKWNGSSIVDAGLPTSGSLRAWDIGDYNNDGLPDVYASTTFGTTRLFRSNGNGTFSEVTGQDNVATAGGGRAGGFVDYNNDGFLDIYNYTGLNSVLQKNSGNSNHWIGFVPVGKGHNLNAIGARFTVYTQGGSFKQYRWVKGEGNAPGHGEMRALFGIGINTMIDSVNVVWPDGQVATYTGLAVDKYWTVKQGSTVPGMATLTAPANNATGAAVTDTLKWDAATGALSYNVQVSLDPTFTKKALLAVNATVTGTEYVFTLGAATKYYWRVGAVNAGFASEFTAANNFTTAGSAASTVPTQVAPPNMGTSLPSLLSLKVNRTADASRYQWQVSNMPSFTVLYADEVTADTAYPGAFTGGQTFYWRVRGLNDLGATAYSQIDTFSIMAPPARTTLVAPANSAINVVSDSVFFSWRMVANAASYNLQLSTISSSVTYATTDTMFRVNGLAKLTNYTWKVEAINAGGTSYYTGTSSFTTVPAVPASPQLLLPASAAAGVNRAARFTWRASLNANKYRLQIGLDNAFTPPLVADTLVLDTTAVLATPLAINTDYYWRLNAQNYGGAGVWGGPQLFTTGTVLAVDVEEGVPGQFALEQNYPNPFNPSTVIRYDVPKAAQVKITIYDILGREVTTLVNGTVVAGRFNATWNATGLATGVYIYRMEGRPADGGEAFSAVKKLLLMK
jgi:hypothetical protein